MQQAVGRRCHVVGGIEERGRVSGEREEDFVEHGRGNGKSLAWRGCVFRFVSRSEQAMSTLKSSNRHMGRVAVRACAVNADELGLVLWRSTSSPH